jgi:hypothetical protein
MAANTATKKHPSIKNFGGKNKNKLNKNKLLFRLKTKGNPNKQK